MSMTPPSPDAIQLRQRLTAFDTGNPPGNEAACIDHIRELVAESGIESTLLAQDPDRPNLIARLEGRADAIDRLLQRQPGWKLAVSGRLTAANAAHRAFEMAGRI